jgi:hypothetical protein
VVLLRATSTRALLLGAVAAALIGCPQLLDDRFGVGAALPGTNLDSGGNLPGSDSDAGVDPISVVGSGGSSGSSGAGGSSGTAGSGSSGGPDASAGGSAETPDAASGGTAGSAADAGDSEPFVALTDIGALLVHRYRFEGSGSTVLDSVGTAHGTATGAVLDGSGKLGLSGSSSEYVALPNGILSSLGNATLEAWVNWQAASASSAADWQPIFDLGNSIDGSQTQSISHLFAVAKSGDTGHMSASYTLHGFNSEILIDTTTVMPASADTAQGTQVVLVANATQGTLELYLNGSRIGPTPTGQAIDLSAISDVNNRLGHSQYSSDPGFQGEFLDFRIYGRALTAAQVSESFTLGADAHL